MLKNRRDIKIEWGDCDPAGIVFYPRYFAYFDASTMALFEAAGLPKRKMLADYGVAGFPMVDTKAKFYYPSHYGDSVTIESKVIRWGNSSFEIEHTLMRGADIAVVGFEKRVWAIFDPEDQDKLKAVPVPDDVKQKFA